MNPKQNATTPHTPTQLAYTPRQAAQMLGLSEPALRARLFRGQLPAVRWGRRVLIRHDDLLKVIGRA
jgi:excisionase family DNA binding protein